MEASGTGNMKLALNGAITIGTLDGANIEIRERVGADNFVLFGLTAAEAAQRRAQGLDMQATIDASPPLARALDAIASGLFSPDDPRRFAGLVEGLRRNDYFLVCADFASYVDAQARVDAWWRDPGRWWQAAIANTASVGFFSSDRAIREYAGEVWGLPPTRR
jgi:starch phosphorylase